MDRTLVIAHVDRVRIAIPGGGGTAPVDVFVNHVFITEVAIDADTGLPAAAFTVDEVTPGRLEFQMQPAITAEGDRRGLSYYETVTPPGGDPVDTEDVRYFGDYIAITVFTAWADARDGCLSQGNAGETWHQHTYGASWF